MSYDFSFDKKTITFLLAGTAFVGIMLFLAGLLVGAAWKTEPTATAAATLPQPAASPAQELTPTEPVLTAEAAKPQPVAPAVVVAAPALAPATALAPTPTKQAHSAFGINNGRATAPLAIASNGDDDIKIIQEANPSAAEPGRPEKSEKTNQAQPEKMAYSVQVGVFVDESQAAKLVQQMQSKGYTPSVLTANDDEYRQWYAVRIGAYIDKTEATQAAVNIAKQEKMKAIVRPFGSL